MADADIASSDEVNEDEVEPLLSRRNSEAVKQNYLTNVEACISILSGTVAIAALSMPMAFKEVGSLGGIFGTLFLAILNMCSLHLLLDLANAYKASLGEDGEYILSTYGDVAEYCAENTRFETFRYFSRWFRWVTDAFLTCQQLGNASIVIITVAKCLQELLHAAGYRIIDTRVMILYISVLFILYGTLVNQLKVLSKISIICMICIFSSVAFIISYYSLDIVVSSGVSDSVVVFSPYHLPQFFGVAMFAYQQSIMIVPIRNELKDPESFGSKFGALNMSVLISTILFLSIGIVTYLRLGDKISEELFGFPDKWYFDIVRIVYIIAVALTFNWEILVPYEILLNPWEWLTFKVLFYCKMKSVDVYDPRGSFTTTVTWNSAVIRAILRLLLVCIALALSLAIPCLENVITIVGALTSAITTFLLPAMLSFLHKASTLKEAVFLFLLLLASGALAVMALSATFYDLASKDMNC